MNAIEDRDRSRSCSMPRSGAIAMSSLQRSGTDDCRQFEVFANGGQLDPFTSWWTPAPPSLKRRRHTIIPHTRRRFVTQSTRAKPQSSTEDEIRLTDKPKVIIIGGGPNRIGQGIEFDYCCVQAAFAMRELGIESVMINSNPETVSTDYDTSDLLFFEPLTHEDILNICERLNGGPFTPDRSHGSARQAREISSRASSSNSAAKPR